MASYTLKLDWDDTQLDILRRALAHYANRNPPEYAAAKAISEVRPWQ